MPSCVSRIGAGRAKITVEISPGTTPSPNSTSVGMRYTNVGRVCIRSSDRPHGGVQPGAVRGRDPERHADQRGDDGRDKTSESVSSVGSQ